MNTKQSERKVYLDKQNEVGAGFGNLQNAIRKIDKETEPGSETFDKINSGLQSLFPRIFGGGHAIWT